MELSPDPEPSLKKAGKRGVQSSENPKSPKSIQNKPFLNRPESNTKVRKDEVGSPQRKSKPIGSSLFAKRTTGRVDNTENRTERNEGDTADTGHSSGFHFPKSGSFLRAKVALRGGKDIPPDHKSRVEFASHRGPSFKGALNRLRVLSANPPPSEISQTETADSTSADAQSSREAAKKHRTDEALENDENDDLAVHTVSRIEVQGPPRRSVSVGDDGPFPVHIVSRIEVQGPPRRCVSVDDGPLPVHTVSRIEVEGPPSLCFSVDDGPSTGQSSVFSWKGTPSDPQAETEGVPSSSPKKNRTARRSLLFNVIPRPKEPESDDGSINSDFSADSDAALSLRSEESFSGLAKRATLLFDPFVEVQTKSKQKANRTNFEKIAPFYKNTISLKGRQPGASAEKETGPVSFHFLPRAKTFFSAKQPANGADGNTAHTEKEERGERSVNFFEVEKEGGPQRSALPLRTPSGAQAGATGAPSSSFKNRPGRRSMFFPVLQQPKESESDDDDFQSADSFGDSDDSDAAISLRSGESFSGLAKRASLLYDPFVEVQCKSKQKANMSNLEKLSPFRKGPMSPRGKRTSATAEKDGGTSSFLFNSRGKQTGAPAEKDGGTSSFLFNSRTKAKSSANNAQIDIAPDKEGPARFSAGALTGIPSGVRAETDGAPVPSPKIRPGRRSLFFPAMQRPKESESEVGAIKSHDSDDDSDDSDDTDAAASRAISLRSGESFSGFAKRTSLLYDPFVEVQSKSKQKAHKTNFEKHSPFRKGPVMTLKGSQSDAPGEKAGGPTSFQFNPTRTMRKSVLFSPARQSSHDDEESDKDDCVSEGDCAPWHAR